MRPPFRSRQQVIIDAPLEAVWSFSMDLTKIPEFHPRVVKVDLLSGKTLREPGASYQCHLSGGKHTCIEKDIEIIPLQKIVTVLPEDTFGISKILSDYRVETTFQTLGNRSTKVEISGFVVGAFPGAMWAGAAALHARASGRGCCQRLHRRGYSGRTRRERWCGRDY